jgi:tetratricopeptide (TPR) repeat protein
MLLGYYNSKKNLEQAEKDFLEILKGNTNHASARIALADLYNIQGKQKLAMEQLKLAFEANILNAESSIQVLLSVLERQTEIDPMALELALILQKNHPDNFMPYALLGEIYNQQGNKKEGLLAFEQSLELNMDNYDLWLEVIATKYTLKRYDDCLKSAEKALELFPSQPQLYYYAGMSSLHKKSFADALNHFETGKDYVIRDPAFKAQFELAIAEVYLEEKNIPKGRKHLESADYLAPNEKLLMNNRAFLMAKYKLDLDKALTLIQQASEGNENDPLFLDTYAWVYFAKKEYDKALEFITRAHNKSPKNAEINEHFGDILFKLGRIDEAVSYWKKAQELGDESAALEKKIKSKKLDN